MTRMLGLTLLLATHAPFAQEPIRVGTNVQASKLIHRVEPVYPAEALAARVAGTVILQVEVSAAGDVSDVKVLRGHPLLDSAAIEAVKQWRYSSTLLNGVPVPVMATVTVMFDPSPKVPLLMNEVGVIRDPASGLEGDALVEKLRGSNSSAAVTVHPGAPYALVQDAIKALFSNARLRFSIEGAYAWRDGRLYYAVPPPAGVISPGVAAPELALDRRRLEAMARGTAPPVGPTGNRRPLIYRLFINEVGEVVSVERVVGEPSDALEAELARTGVVTPARLRGDPVPCAVYVEVAVN
jgi:TonB family protein